MYKKSTTGEDFQQYSSVKDYLEIVYQKLYRKYGPQQWWPAENPFEIALGAILGQNTSWKNAEKALTSLKTANILSPVKIQQISEEQLAQLIYSSGSYNVKAKKIKSFVQFLYDQFNNDIQSFQDVGMNTLRQELLSGFGIGEETADDILIYIAKKPSFIIDAYTRRIIDRLGLSPITKKYSSYKSLFMKNVQNNYQIFGEYHALLVALAKDTCKVNPVCMRCCLLSICQTGKNTR